MTQLQNKQALNPNTSKHDRAPKQRPMLSPSPPYMEWRKKVALNESPQPPRMHRLPQAAARISYTRLVCAAAPEARAVVDNPPAVLDVMLPSRSAVSRHSYSLLACLSLSPLLSMSLSLSHLPIHEHRRVKRALHSTGLLSKLPAPVC